MVSQINTLGSVATDVAQAGLVAAKPQPAQEIARASQAAESQPAVAADQPVQATGKELDSAIKELSTHLNQSGSKLEIQRDKDSGRNVVKVVDPKTGTVVVQFPPEEVLAMARKLRETAKALDIPGVLVDKEG